MADSIFLQNDIFTQFLLPFLLSFFIVFAILEKTKLFGEGKKQLNALTAFVVGLIFITAIYPKLVVSNLILFMTVALVAIFVILLIWGFIMGDYSKFQENKVLKWILVVVAGIAFIAALIWAAGWYDGLVSFFSNAGLNQTILTNVVFVVVIAVALALVLKGSKAAK